jgi:serine O-acetyltransferase
MTTTASAVQVLPATTISIENGTNDHPPLDELSIRLRQEAQQALQEEPELAFLLKNTVLAPCVRTFEDAVAATVTYRMLLLPCHDSSASPSMFCPHSLLNIFTQAFQATNFLEAGHTMAEAVRRDALAVVERDPAVDTVLEVVLFLKGFASLVAHRAAHYKWHSTSSKSLTALWLQSQASAVFGVDIHPAAQMGAGILLDHGTGIVIGETATVGDCCTLLHGVTLGGTGKEVGDRHPKVGADVLIGANASLLGNIVIGNGAKIGAGSVVLGHIPSGATAVGAPAKIIGRAKEAKPGSTIDEALKQVSHLHKSESSATVTTTDTTSHTSSRSNSSMDSDSDVDEMIPEETEHNDKKEETTNSMEVPKTIHHPTKPHKDTSSNTNCCCPFREYVRMSVSAPPGSITICVLRRLLLPEGCTSFEIGEVLFQLDTHNVGYCKPEVFFKTGRNVLAQKTRLTMERIEEIMTTYERQRNQEQKKLTP